MALGSGRYHRQDGRAKKSGDDSRDEQCPLHCGHPKRERMGSTIEWLYGFR
jgi:hypothetical protein